MKSRLCTDIGGNAKRSGPALSTPAAKSRSSSRAREMRCAGFTCGADSSENRSGSTVRCAPRLREPNREPYKRIQGLSMPSYRPDQAAQPGIFEPHATAGVSWPLPRLQDPRARTPRNERRKGHRTPARGCRSPRGLQESNFPDISQTYIRLASLSGSRTGWGKVDALGGGNMGRSMLAA